MRNRATGHRMRHGVLRQRLLPAIERGQRRERRFKAAILVLTVLAVMGLLAGTPIGRSGSVTLTRRLKWAVLPGRRWRCWR